MEPLTLKESMRMIEAGLEKAGEIGIKVAIAVLDPSDTVAAPPPPPSVSIS